MESKGNVLGVMGEVYVRGENSQSFQVGNGRNEEISVGTLDTMFSAFVIEVRCQFKMIGTQADVRKNNKSGLEQFELLTMGNTRQQLLANGADYFSPSFLDEVR